MVFVKVPLSEGEELLLRLAPLGGERIAPVPPFAATRDQIIRMVQHQPEWVVRLAGRMMIDESATGACDRWGLEKNLLSPCINESPTHFATNLPSPLPPASQPSITAIEVCDVQRSTPHHTVGLIMGEDDLFSFWWIHVNGATGGLPKVPKGFEMDDEGLK
uniref:Uncharacterized protein n=1 Tax=Anopheles coluzzii TaxID=1518534 RepID=A0A8W7PHI1_ANOCL